MEYKFREIEKKWQQWWKDNEVYKVSNVSSKPKYYVLDMFPYPSGAGLHVGHPLGYIASDIYARFKMLKGFHVLHPMGYDAFGLPAEQYAIDHGIHPAVSTEANINNFRKQLDNIGFCFDWSREVRTSDPKFYKWTQWIFLQLFDSWYNRRNRKAERITILIEIFRREGNVNHPIPDSQFQIPNIPLRAHDSPPAFTAEEWEAFDEVTQQNILMEYRLAYCGYGEVNWCEALGTVLANDEVINGVSERGGYPVVRKKLRQWYLRITEYADRLLEGLEQVNFSEAMKEMQTNWIGKSYGANVRFRIQNSEARVEVYTTRPDTIFGVDFMVIAPEHELVNQIVAPEQEQAVEEYLAHVKSRSERERMAEKKISGVFTGSYCLHPFSAKEIPIWISEYVLVGYGTGAIMAVPCGDERDHKFAKHFGLEITNIVGSHYDGEKANPTSEAILENSDFMNGMVMKDAIEVVIRKLEELDIGERRVNYKMHDAAFSRQRYWGEPIPIVWKNTRLPARAGTAGNDSVGQGIAYPLDEKQLPLELPHLESYGSGPEGEGPLANIPGWVARGLETNTMPGYAGSSWYFLRYMDPHNEKEFCHRKFSDYWGQVDLYIGGTEHAVGHLLYSRLWTKALYDLGYIGYDEPYRRLVNQGKIGGDSRIVYRIKGTNTFVSAGLQDQYETDELHADVNIVDGHNLDIEAFKNWKPDFKDAEFILEGGKYICVSRLEKMSKRYFNIVNPDDVVAKFGADTFRMYEMFLGPVEQDKPWDTKGIEGVHRFLKRFWRLFIDEEKGLIVTNEPASGEELKVLHKTIKKIEEDTERFSFNTGVSAFMIATNELADLKCHKHCILEPLLILLAPYAPHISEELWHLLGHVTSIAGADYPRFEGKYVRESSKTYPVAINGKTRTELMIALDATQQEVEEVVLANDIVKKWLAGKPPKKVIYVKNKMVNVVL